MTPITSGPSLWNPNLEQNGSKHLVVFDKMTAKGVIPKLQTMDNQASAALKKYFTEKEMNYQLGPPRIVIEPMLQNELSELSRII
jgi:hypothetical protein